MRMLSMIALDQMPDLSDGPQSIAGRFTRKNEDKYLEVPFTYKNLEQMAFSTLLLRGEGFSGSTQKELLHYTMMRLYSADKRFRKCSDYVVFSIHRLEAFGFEQAQQFLRDLPAPVPRSNLHLVLPSFIAFRPGFHKQRPLQKRVSLDNF